MRPNRGIRSKLLHFLCTFSLVLLAFSHRPAVLDAAQIAELSLGALPNGMEYVICLTDGSDGSTPVSGNHCEACRIGSAILVPIPPTIPTFLGGSVVQVAQLLDQNVTPPSLYELRRITRGPPTSFS